MGIVDKNKNIKIDHKNGNRLDNRKCNLRFCTTGQNSMNKGKQKNNKSGYKGVYWHGQDKMWCVQITLKGKTYSGGVYKNVVDAAKKYNEMAKIYHKSFARLNNF